MLWLEVKPGKVAVRTAQNGTKSGVRVQNNLRECLSVLCIFAHSRPYNAKESKEVRGARQQQYCFIRGVTDSVEPSIVIIIPDIRVCICSLQTTSFSISMASNQYLVSSI